MRGPGTPDFEPALAQFLWNLSQFIESLWTSVSLSLKEQWKSAPLHVLLGRGCYFTEPLPPVGTPPPLGGRSACPQLQDREACLAWLAEYNAGCWPAGDA